jgi:hypothetical protein
MASFISEVQDTKGNINFTGSVKEYANMINSQENIAIHHSRL